MLTLQVTKRDGSTKAAKLRREGIVPAVVYGAHHEATPVAVPLTVFEKVFREAGEASIVSLTGMGEPVPTLIHQVDLNPLTHKPQHVDFYAVTKGEKVQVAIPLEFTGESAAVEAGANLVKVLYEIEVEADPMNLPHDIKVDISVLKAAGDKVHASDLSLPTGVVLMVPPEEVVALAQEVVEEQEEAAPADLSAIEVEKKGKEEGAEGEGASEEKAGE